MLFTKYVSYNISYIFIYILEYVPEADICKSIQAELDLEYSRNVVTLHKILLHFYKLKQMFAIIVIDKTNQNN